MKDFSSAQSESAHTHRHPHEHACTYKSLYSGSWNAQILKVLKIKKCITDSLVSEEHNTNSSMSMYNYVDQF